MSYICHILIKEKKSKKIRNNVFQNPKKPVCKTRPFLLNLNPRDILAHNSLRE